MSQADVTVGIPAIVNCLIMVPFSIFFHYAYDVGPYMIGRRHHHPEGGYPSEHSYAQHYQGGFLGIRAFAGMMNPRELLSAIGFVFKMGPPKKSSTTPAPYGGAAGARDDGYAHEMGRREQRRIGKHGPRAGGGHYENGNGNGNTNGYGGYQQRQQNGGNQKGQYQGGYR